MVMSKTFIYAKEFEGYPKISDFKLLEEDLPTIKEGEFLAEAVFLSVDPYMRRHGKTLSLGSVFIGSQVARITDSKNGNFPVGKYVVGEFGWRTHTISQGEKCGRFPDPYILPDFGNVPLSLGIGMLGMTGNTAYFGFLDVCQPKSGDVVIISGAGGAIGSHVGQIAKIIGCTVIGIAGSDEKGHWLLELGFDYFINYKTDNIEEKIKEYAPKGIDCYFDNVGGKISSTVLKHLKMFARVCICGTIAGYNDGKSGIIELPMLRMPFKLERFYLGVPKYLDVWMTSVSQNLKWLQEGKLRYRETVITGFENTPQAFIDMLEGDDSKKKWKSIRDGYNMFKKKHALGTGFATPKNSKDHRHHQSQFLDGVLQYRSGSSNF